MTQDQMVRTQDVLRSVMGVRRVGGTEMLRQLEQIEPDLTEFLLEELSAIHGFVLALGGKPKLERRVIRRVESMALVLVTALREAQLRLWSDLAEGNVKAADDPKPSEPLHPPTPPSSNQDSNP